MSDFDYRALDPVIHSRLRLAAVSLLASVDEAEFTWLRDAVGTTDGNLSTHLTRLVDAGYVEANRTTGVTRYALTGTGRAAFRTYVDHLEHLLHPHPVEKESP